MKKENTQQKITKGEKTKQKLFSSAAKLFNQYDFEEVTVDKIVEEAGVAKGTFYIHFESKDALIAAYLSDYVRETDTNYRAILYTFSPETPTPRILMGLTEKIADILSDTIGVISMKTVYKLMLMNSFDMSAVSGYGRDLYLMFSELLDRGIKRKEFNNTMPVNEIARHFVMAIRGLCFEWCIRYPDFDLKAQVQSHFKIMLDGILTKQETHDQ
ncbi:MAG TPA: TetR/AcrR family transcriptional regulator [Clostridiaceae bacterium]|jgi:AcrR family transcriptional regulator|nr:TetR/AcrR family transcriptional regulator [Clostridiaceae bacterium]